MTTRFLIRAALVLGMLLPTLRASADITYVDATWAGDGTNTTLVDGSAVEVTDSASGSDGLWRVRAYGNGEILEAGGASGNEPGEDVPTLKTTVGSGSDADPRLPAGTYNVYVYYWQDEAGSPWRIEASLDRPVEKPADAGAAEPENSAEMAATDAADSSGDDQPADAEADAGPLMPLYMPGDGKSVLASDESTKFAAEPVVKDADGRVMWEVLLGQVTLDGNTPIVVYVDTDSSNNGEVVYDSNERTWYDGVGYELAP